MHVNKPFYAVISAPFLVAALFVLAGAARKQRQRHRAWLMERSAP